MNSSAEERSYSPLNQGKQSRPQLRCGTGLERSLRLGIKQDLKSLQSLPAFTSLYQVWGKTENLKLFWYW
jgi:hypothetical protein